MGPGSHCPAQPGAVWPHCLVYTPRELSYRCLYCGLRSMTAHPYGRDACDPLEQAAAWTGSMERPPWPPWGTRRAKGFGLLRRG